MIISLTTGADTHYLQTDEPAKFVERMYSKVSGGEYRYTHVLLIQRDAADGDHASGLSVRIEDLTGVKELETAAHREVVSNDCVYQSYSFA